MLMKLLGEVGVSFVQRYSLLPTFNLPISIFERLSLKQTYLTSFDLAVWHMAAPKSKVSDFVVTIIFVSLFDLNFFRSRPRGRK